MYVNAKVKIAPLQIYYFFLKFWIASFIKVNLLTVLGSFLAF